MDFFERQEWARRNTKRLVMYFFLAVVGIVFAVYFAIYGVLFLVDETPPKSGWFDLEIFGWTVAGVLLVVTGGSLYRIAELSQGGRVVAMMLGGRLLDLNTTKPDERRLLNVVEEMAIASGVPVPDVYLLDEERGINAFAAGNGPGDAVIGVTRGCLEKLTRDELQGVVAHEFSHILNGDMRLNLRLIGLLHGILCIAIIGRILMEIGARSTGRSNKKDGAGVQLAFIVLGLAFLLIGWIGVFFGNLIKAAVSRQREFLADASAVQFTRNPKGISGALYKIGRASSQLVSIHAEEASHLFFSSGIKIGFTGLFATHPPIDERIRAIDPNFNPQEVQVQQPPRPKVTEKTMAKEWLQGAGLARPEHLYYAAALLASIPEAERAAAHEVHGAMALVFALLLSEEEEVREGQLRELRLDAATEAEVRRHFAERSRFTEDQRIALIDLCIPALRQLSEEQYRDFRAKVRHLVESDGQITLFEFVLQKILTRHLDLHFCRKTGEPVRFRAIAPVLPEVTTLLSGLAWIGQEGEQAREAAFRSGVQELMVKAPVVREDGCDLAGIDAALDRLALASPEVKRRVLAACGRVVAHDGVIEPREGALLRAIADALDCPVPPFARGSDFPES